jgi:hypothetical protein
VHESSSSLVSRDPLEEDCCNTQILHSFRGSPGAWKSLINAYLTALFPVFDWLDSLIGLGGLLLVVSHVFGGVPVLEL